MLSVIDSTRGLSVACYIGECFWGRYFPGIWLYGVAPSDAVVAVWSPCSDDVWVFSAPPAVLDPHSLGKFLSMFVRACFGFEGLL